MMSIQFEFYVQFAVIFFLNFQRRGFKTPPALGRNTDGYRICHLELLIFSPVIREVYATLIQSVNKKIYTRRGLVTSKSEVFDVEDSVSCCCCCC